MIKLTGAYYVFCSTIIGNIRINSSGAAAAFLRRMKHIMEDRSDADKLFVDAEHAEEREDFENAAAFLERAANLEHTGAQINLGNFYSWGRGYPNRLREQHFGTSAHTEMVMNPVRLTSE